MARKPRPELYYNFRQKSMTYLLHYVQLAHFFIGNEKPAGRLIENEPWITRVLIVSPVIARINIIALDASGNMAVA